MSSPVIAIAGGTGHLGQALVQRWAQAGHRVLIGSRTAERAQAAAQEIGARLQAPLESGTNAEVAVAAHKLAAGERMDCDMLVFGDEKEQRQRVIE